MTPQEMLSAMEVGGGLAARAQQFDLQKQKFALDSAQVNLQMNQERQTFPLKLGMLQLQSEIADKARQANEQGLIEFADTVKGRPLNDPQLPSDLIGVLGKHPYLADNPAVKETFGLMGQNTAQALRVSKMENDYWAAMERLRLQGERNEDLRLKADQDRQAKLTEGAANRQTREEIADKRINAPPAIVKELQAADKMEQDALAEDEKGNAERANRLRLDAGLIRTRHEKSTGIKSALDDISTLDKWKAHAILREFDAKVKGINPYLKDPKTGKLPDVSALVDSFEKEAFDKLETLRKKPAAAPTQKANAPLTDQLSRSTAAQQAEEKAKLIANRKADPKFVFQHTNGKRYVYIGSMANPLEDSEDKFVELP